METYSSLNWHVHPCLFPLPGLWFSPAVSRSSTSLASIPVIHTSWPGFTTRPQHGHWQTQNGTPSPHASRLSGKDMKWLDCVWRLRAINVARIRNLNLFTLSVSQARVALPGGLAMHSIPGRQVCIDTGLPPFFHMPPPAHAHAPAPSSPQPQPSPHSSHTHKVRGGRHKHTVKADLSRTDTQTHTFALFHFIFLSAHSLSCSDALTPDDVTTGTSLLLFERYRGHYWLLNSSSALFL